MSADLVLRGGPVFTGAGWTDAVALRGALVAAVGAGEVDSLVTSGTRVVDLSGRMALPGFHDAHTHLIGGAMTGLRLDVTAVRSRAALREAVAAWAQSHDGWITGRGWDADAMEDGLPCRADLDAAAPGRPVALRRRDGHATVVSSKALELAGIGAGTPDPPGGRIVRDAAGEPTGVLLEDPAIELVEELFPPIAPAILRAAVADALLRASALGITSLQDDPSFTDLRAGELYADLHERGELPVRVSVWRKLGRSHDDLRAEEEALQARGVSSDHVRFSLLKGYLDGSLGSRTAQLFEPYTDDASAGTGVDLDEVGALPAHVVAADAAGYQVGLHAIGDRAAARALDAFAACPRVAELRHRIEHAQMLRPDDVRRAAALGVVASVQPIHLASDMLVAEARLGSERCGTAYPWAQLEQAGALLAFGTDFPVEPLGPVPGLVCAVARRSPRDLALPAFWPDQAVSLETALTAYTLGAARASHLEARLGRLAPGCLADVAVLSADLRSAPVESWGQVRCELTVRGGEVVHEV